MNKATDRDMIISEYKLDMCHRAVKIIGQETQQNIKKIEAQGTEDNSFNLFNIHVSSAGIGIGMLVVLFLIFKIIKVSNVKSWSAVGRCLFPCCGHSHRTSTQDHPNDTDNTNLCQFNSSNRRTNRRQNSSPTSACGTANRRSEGAGSQRQYRPGQERIHSSPCGSHKPLTALERRLQAYEHQSRSQEWLNPTLLGPWQSAHQAYYSRQPGANPWQSNQQDFFWRQPEFSPTNHILQELPRYLKLYPQEKGQMGQRNQKIQASNLRPPRREDQEQSMDAENRRIQEGQEALRQAAPGAPAQETSWGGRNSEPDQSYIKEFSATCRPSFCCPWDHPGHQQEQEV